MNAYDGDSHKYIPRISPEDVRKLLTKITPLVRVDDQLFLYEPAEPRNPFETSFAWERNTSKGAVVAEQDLLLLEVLETYHRCSYAMLFKPSIAEVLAQIPLGLMTRVTAFEVLFSPEITTVLDLPGFYGHRTQTRLYGK